MFFSSFSRFTSKSKEQKRPSFYKKISEGGEGSIDDRQSVSTDAASPSPQKKSLLSRAKDLLMLGKPSLSGSPDSLFRPSGVSVTQPSIRNSLARRESDSESVSSRASSKITQPINRISRNPPLPLVAMYSPQTWAFLGRFDEISGAIRDNRNLLDASFDWLQDNKNIQPDIPPHHLPELVRNALIDALECQRVTIDQRYLLQRLFSGSSLLHYACAGNQYSVVKLLLDSGANPSCVNNGGKEADYYTTDQSIIDLFAARRPKQEKRIIPPPPPPPLTEAASTPENQRLSGRIKSNRPRPPSTKISSGRNEKKSVRISTNVDSSSPPPPPPPPDDDDEWEETLIARPSTSNRIRNMRESNKSTFIDKLSEMTRITDTLQELAMEDIALKNSPINTEAKTFHLEATMRKALRPASDRDESNFKDKKPLIVRKKRDSVVLTNDEVEVSTKNVLEAIPISTKRKPIRMSIIKRDDFISPTSPIENETTTNRVGFVDSVSSHEGSNNQKRRSGSVSVFSNENEEKGGLADSELVERISKRGSFFQLYDSMATLMLTNATANPSSSINNPNISDIFNLKNKKIRENNIEDDVESYIRASIEKQNNDVNISYDEIYSTPRENEPWHQRLDRQVPKHRVKNKEKFIKSRLVDVDTPSNRVLVVTNKDMIWKRAAGSIGMTHRGDIDQMKDEALSEGIQMLKNEFQAYADIERWEGIEGPKKINNLQKFKKQIIFRRTSVIQKY